MSKIAFDMRMMKPFPTGIGSHYLNLVKTYVTKHSENEYILIINKRGEKIVKDFFEGVDVNYFMIDVNGGSFKQILKTFLINKQIKSLNADLVITDIWSSLPYMSFKYVLMMYDLIGFKGIVKVSFKQKLFDIFLYKHTARKAALIIASTRSVLEDTVKYLGVDKDKIKIVMPSVSKEYQDKIDGKLVDKMISKFKLTKGKYFVYIGNRRPHKNLLLAIKAFSLFIEKSTDRNFSFVIVGNFDDSKSRAGDSLLEYLNDNYKEYVDNIVLTGRIDSNAEVAALLNGATALFHPSLMEGFGLTPLEAIFSGTCVVVSNIDAIKDVVMDAALFVDPRDEEDCAEKLLSISGNKNLREDLLQKEQKIKETVTWDNATHAFSEAISSCL